MVLQYHPCILNHARHKSWKLLLRHLFNMRGRFTSILNRLNLIEVALMGFIFKRTTTNLIGTCTYLYMFICRYQKDYLCFFIWFDWKFLTRKICFSSHLLNLLNTVSICCCYVEIISEVQNPLLSTLNFKRVAFLHIPTVLNTVFRAVNKV